MYLEYDGGEVQSTNDALHPLLVLLTLVCVGDLHPQNETQ